ncbi:Uncharacterised protein [Mycobacteroides abscessus subsp. massiliense]|nr:Uncharacterised protein [Mycobacteroides abscessus subsp. massiliense]
MLQTHHHIGDRAIPDVGDGAAHGDHRVDGGDRLGIDLIDDDLEELSVAVGLGPRGRPRCAEEDKREDGKYCRHTRRVAMRGSGHCCCPRPDRRPGVLCVLECV